MIKPTDKDGLWMDRNGRLWFFKRNADTEPEYEPKVPLFSRHNLSKLKRHLEDIITERNKKQLRIK